MVPVETATRHSSTPATTTMSHRLSANSSDTFSIDHGIDVGDHALDLTGLDAPRSAGWRRWLAVAGSRRGRRARSVRRPRGRWPSSLRSGVTTGAAMRGLGPCAGRGGASVPGAGSIAIAGSVGTPRGRSRSPTGPDGTAHHSPSGPRGGPGIADPDGDLDLGARRPRTTRGRPWFSRAIATAAGRPRAAPANAAASAAVWARARSPTRLPSATSPSSHRGHAAASTPASTRQRLTLVSTSCPHGASTSPRRRARPGCRDGRAETREEAADGQRETSGSLSAVVVDARGTGATEATVSSSRGS